MHPLTHFCTILCAMVWRYPSERAGYRRASGGAVAVTIASKRRQSALFALEGDTQPELQLPWCTERINTRANTDTINIVCGSDGSVDLTGCSCEQSVQG